MAPTLESNWVCLRRGRSKQQGDRSIQCRPGRWLRAAGEARNKTQQQQKTFGRDQSEVSLLWTPKATGLTETKTEGKDKSQQQETVLFCF